MSSFDQALNLLQTVEEEMEGVEQRTNQGGPDSLTPIEIQLTHIRALVGIGYALLAVRKELRGQRIDADPDSDRWD